MTTSMVQCVVHARSADRTTHPNSTRTHALAAVLYVVAAIWCGACDGEGGGSGAADEAQGEPCTQPGFTATDCTCATGVMGSRRCTQERVWTPCSCRPPRGPNECDYEGQEILCDPCAGASERRTVLCPASLTFDCSCDGQADPVVSMDAGSAGEQDDADAAVPMDAAMQQDDEQPIDDDAGRDDDGG